MPIWLLGLERLFGAQLAAELGLPFAFASHFAPDYLHEALALYRARLQAVRRSSTEPYVMVGVNVFAADTDAEARRLFTSLAAGFLNLRPRHAGPLPPPVESMERLWIPPSGSTSSG